MSNVLPFPPRAERRVRTAHSLRDTPRVPLEVPVAVLLPDRPAASGRSLDLCPGGVRIATDRTVALAIHPTARAIRPGEEPEIGVSIALPADGGDARVLARCRVRHFGLLEDGAVAFGLEFVSLGAPDARNVERFIERSLVPAEALGEGG